MDGREEGRKGNKGKRQMEKQETRNAGEGRRTEQGERRGERLWRQSRITSKLHATPT